MSHPLLWPLQSKTDLNTDDSFPWNTFRIPLLLKVKNLVKSNFSYLFHLAREKLISQYKYKIHTGLFVQLC